MRARCRLENITLRNQQKATYEQITVSAPTERWCLSDGCVHESNMFECRVDSGKDSEANWYTDY